jgi:hypothetical protein
MQKIIRIFGKPFFLYLFFFLIFNANGQLISAKMEKDFREDARIKVARVAKMIDQGIERYEKEGPRAFVDSFGSSLTPTDKNMIIKELKGLPPMPRVKMEGVTLVFFHKNKKIAEFDSYDVAQGIYQSGDLDFYYDTNLSLSENIEAWKKTHNKNAETSSFFWMNLILPQAEANNKNARMIPLLFAAGILGMIIGSFLEKWAYKPKVATSKESHVEPSTASSGSVPDHGTPEAKKGKTATPKKQTPAAAQSKRRNELIKKAEKLGIQNPEKLTDDKLKEEIQNAEKAAPAPAAELAPALSTESSQTATPVSTRSNTEATDPKTDNPATNTPPAPAPTPAKTLGIPINPPTTNYKMNWGK